MKPTRLELPQLFKGIALFTPGGDLIYCIDPDKQGRWHLHLCATLQEILCLAEPPHFLIPCYTATIDRWLDPQTQQIKTFAEANPLVMRHQALLNCLFNTSNLVWEGAIWQEKLCDRMMLMTYRASFPQLWEDHDLIVNLDVSNRSNSEYSQVEVINKELSDKSHVLRLFIAGHSAATESILEILYELLETHLRHPYTLKVIDVLRHPEQAEFNQVSATPTLMKVWPHPIRRIVGNLDNTERILYMLGVSK